MEDLARSSGRFCQVGAADESFLQRRRAVSVDGLSFRNAYKKCAADGPRMIWHDLNAVPNHVTLHRSSRLALGFSRANGEGRGRGELLAQIQM